MGLSFERLVRVLSTPLGLQHAVAVLTILGWLLLAGLIASLYVGHSPSPYGACASPNGRDVPCALLQR
jgi:hypothetical protein